MYINFYEHYVNRLHNSYTYSYIRSARLQYVRIQTCTPRNSHYFG